MSGHTCTRFAYASACSGKCIVRAVAARVEGAEGARNKRCVCVPECLLEGENARAYDDIF